MRKKILGFRRYYWLVFTTVLIAPRLAHANIIKRFVGDVATSLGNSALSLVETYFLVILNIYIAFSALLLWLVGLLMDFAIRFSLDSSHFAGLDAITIGWATLRDLLNIAFIFLLLYIAISTILGLTGTNVKKMLISIIVAALLVNFSMFFTKLVIDLGNIVGHQFYSAVTVNGETSISVRMMTGFGLQA